MEWRCIAVKQEPEMEGLPLRNVKVEWPEEVESVSCPVNASSIPEFISVESVKQESTLFEEEFEDNLLTPKVELTIENHTIALEEEPPYGNGSHRGTWDTADSSGSFLSIGISERCKPLMSRASVVEDCNLNEKYNINKNISFYPSVNGVQSQQFVCDECKRCFSRRSILIQHLRIHSGERLLKCEECGKVFCRGGDLKHHMSIHSGEKMYKCEECKKSFSRRDLLLGHLTVHGGENLHKCEYCGKCFSLRSNLARHRRIHSSDKRYKCEDCGKCFSQLNNLADHLRCHSGEKPYKCNACAKCFSRHNTLRQHVKIHSGEKPFICVTCGKYFRHRSTLTNHMKIHSN